MFDNDGFDCADFATALGFGEEISQEIEEQQQATNEVTEDTDINETEDTKEELIPLNKKNTSQRKSPKFESWVKDIVTGTKTIDDPL